MAKCWDGAEIRCSCGGETVDLDDEYNGLSGGGDYERFRCTACLKIIRIELPD